ncbi:hypothetical protein [Mycobacterium sp. NPDC050853]|uniref:ImmA/IrrE family metallo-endopeptidase n=1 Tax=Mycobacterium sp. NPDC050853 TaxID=3155160 RepID=UPI0033D30F16
MRGRQDPVLGQILARTGWLAASQIRSAVNEVLANAPTETSSVQDLIQAWGLHRGKSITIEDEVLPAGVFGQWLSFPDRDVLRIRPGALSRERTIAHELGHIALGHHGQPVADYLNSQMQAASTDLVAYMLQRSCDETHAWPREEVAAERFASLLLRRLERAAAEGERLSRHRIDDALN